MSAASDVARRVGVQRIAQRTVARRLTVSSTSATPSVRLPSGGGGTSPRVPGMTDQGIGARLLRKEDDRYMRGRGQYVGDIKLPGMLEVAFLRSPLAHARIKGIRIPPAMRDRVFIAEDLAGVSAIRADTTLPGFKSSRAADPRHRQGALRRRAGRHVRRADARRGRGPRRRDRARPRAAARRRRHAGGAQARRAAGARALGRQPLPHHQHRRRLRGRQGQGRRLGHARAAHRAPGHEPDRGPRRGRALALAARPAGRPHLDPAAAHRPLGARRVPAARRGPDPRDRARRRRRLRLQGHPAARGGRAGLGHAQGRRAAQMDRGPPREPHRQRQLPRASLHPHRLRRRRRPAAGARLRGHRRFRRLLGLSVLGLPGGRPGRLDPAGPLRLPALPLPRLLGRHQQAADPALPRRRPHRRVLRAGGDARCAGAQARHRAQRAALQEPGAAGADAVRQHRQAPLRLRRLPRGPAPGDRRHRLRQGARAPAARASPTAAASASALPCTPSRPATAPASTPPGASRWCRATSRRWPASRPTAGWS